MFLPKVGLWKVVIGKNGHIYTITDAVCKCKCGIPLFFFLAKFFRLLSNFRACFFETGGRLVYLLMYEVQEILGRRKRFLICIFHFIEVLSI